MPGLLSQSQQIRKALEAKNFYTPDNVYDLNSDIVSKTLNTLQAAGFDLRTNLAVNLTERIVDDTALVQIGFQRLAIELGRRVGNNIVNDYQVNPNALFDKNPNSSFITRRKSYKITPSESKYTTAEKIGSYITNNVGILDESSKELFADKNIKIGGSFYYINLGEGQKQQLNTLIGFNYYGNWTKPNTSANYYTVNAYTTSPDRPKPGAGQGLSYISGVFDTNQEINNFAENRYTDADNGTAPIGFATTIASSQLIDKALDEYGFGRTSIEKDTNTDPDQYRVNDTNLVWGDDATFPANANRGLLYYTNNIVKTRTAASNLINQTNKSYKVGNTLVYKGNKCRSWTVKDQYDEFSKLIRFNGNGVENSTLKDSVFPHQYPKKDFNIKPEDKKRYMFSLENLAWKAEDLNLYNIPDCERGPFGGRQMWFPFYGVEFGETEKASVEDIRFIGRIEPLYSYAGAERVGTLKFMMIMDYPTVVNNFRGSEAEFFANCANTATDAPRSIVSTNKVTPGDLAAKTNDESSAELPNNKPTYNALTYFFENDVFNIDPNYEATFSESNPPSYGLNSDFVPNVGSFALTLATVNANNYVFKIDGYASQLFTDNYNTRLGFKRAYQLMLYIQETVNTNASSNDTKLSLEGIENFSSPTFIDKTTADLNTTKVVFKDSKRNITFELYSNGESQAVVEGAAASNKDLKAVKEDRKATASPIGPLKVDDNIVDTTVIPKTSTEINNDIQNNQILDTENVVINDAPCSPFNEYDVNTKFPIDFQKMDFFRPAYHSQTPEDFHKRLTFLHQVTRPGSTIESTEMQAKNSIFGRMPVCVLRLGDFIHTKIIINSINFSYPQNLWDLNPEGMGVQPMIAEVTMDFVILGGQALGSYIDRLQRAVDFNFYANSTFYGDRYYSKQTGTAIDAEGKSYPIGDGPYYQEVEQTQRNKLRGQST